MKGRRPRWLGRGAVPAGPASPSPAEQAQRGEAEVRRGGSVQGRVQGTATLLVTALLGTALLIWYYSSAYARLAAARTTSPPGVLRPLGDAPLPPLAAAAVPASADGREQHGIYRIGDLLGAPNLQEGVAAAESLGNTLPGLPLTGAAGVGPGAGSGAPRVSARDRLVEGAVFVRPASAGAGPEPLEGAPAGAASEHVTDPLTNLLAAPAALTVRASVLPTQRLLLPKGSFIDCTLQTAIDSTLPGLVTCLTAVDTFGADGTVLLMERGTRLFGETRGEVSQGAARVFVLWNEARTPRGVVVPLASPGTDELGRSGLPGQVERHFWDRFGAAILLSTLDGAVQAAATRQGSGSGTVVLNPSGTRDIAAEALRGSIGIAPTVTKRQGDRIQVLVARDLDFRSVYALALRAH